MDYDLYINPKKASVGLYVRKGAGLPDLGEAKDWVFDGSFGQANLPAQLGKEIEAKGHAFRDMD
ncbi:hypothetical protein [Sphingomonas endophytica]|uniref:Uncharacterized protein n=1 Tax=Sphingomonas endophytica TaxID=869719 RepID=A0A147HQH6_9SPHN|nr:hypothetical protein [Sphingomonas endophytica]KTT61025.1 hypothetical protein NS334_17460 [Sphingomonas endophytica]